MTNFLTVLTSVSQRRAAKRFTSAGKTGVELARSYRCRLEPFADIFDLHKILSKLARDPFSLVIRGEPTPSTDLSQPVRRIKYAEGSEGPFFQSSADGARWLCFDFDRVECPEEIDPISDPQDAIDYLRHLLPSEFHDVTCSWQWSSSAGRDGWKLLRAHLWFCIAKSANDDVIREWACGFSPLIDPCVFNTVQPHFTANPIFDGCIDPVKNRNGLLIGAIHAAEVDFSRDTQTMRGSSLRPSLAKPVSPRPEGFRKTRPVLVSTRPIDPRYTNRTKKVADIASQVN